MHFPDSALSQRFSEIQCAARHWQVANRSLIKDLTARDLEARKIAKIIERVEEALTQASRLAKRFATAAQRRAERIREIRTKKRREMVRAARREQNRAAGIAT